MSTLRSLIFHSLLLKIPSKSHTAIEKLAIQAVAIGNECLNTLSWLSSSFRGAIIYKLTIAQQTNINQDLWGNK